jgi:hypothetical protein
MIRQDLFEANVRDYHGDKLVNADIQRSLRSQNAEDFWWLNNGVTILASDAVLSGKTLTLKSPQVVNGLQTSREINEYFRSVQPAEKRNLLVRVIVPGDPASTDRIIKATNSQTPIPPGSLRATDKIQRDIEDHLLTKGLYYDRRRNHYKNAGKPINKIVTIKHVAQALSAVLLQLPHDARGRPSSLLKTDSEYNKIFDPDLPISVFYACLALVRHVDSILRAETSLEPRIRKYLRLHVAMVVAIKTTNTSRPSADQLAQMSFEDIDDTLIRNSLEIVLSAFNKLGATDRIVKNKTLTEELRTRLGKIPKSTRNGTARRKGDSHIRAFR